MGKGILKNVAIDWVNGPEAAGSSTDANSSILDMQGYEGVIFMVPITDSADTGVATLTIETDVANADTGMAASPAVATATSAANDDLNDTLLIAELKKPLERYVQGVITSGTANIAFGDTIAIRYGAHKPPITQSSTTVSHSISVVDS
jgi:hypothetical protein